MLVSSNLGASANENDGASAESIQMIQSRFMTQSVDVFLADYDFFYSLGEFDYLGRYPGISARRSAGRI